MNTCFFPAPFFQVFLHFFLDFAHNFGLVYGTYVGRVFQFSKEVTLGRCFMMSRPGRLGIVLSLCC